MSDLVVVTGAAGALGRAVVAEFRTRGASVAALDRPDSGLSGLAEPADVDGAGAVHAVPVDLTDPAAVDAAWAAIDAIGVPSALVTVAGAFTGGSLEETTPETLESMLQVNLATVVWSVRAAATRMRAAGGGAVVTIGSRTGAAGSGPVAYSAAKAAVIRLTEVLADELRPDAIRVNTVLPSVIDTPSNRSWMSPEAVSRAVAPAAVATIIGFLCSPDAAPISGAAIPVYGAS